MKKQTNNDPPVRWSASLGRCRWETYDMKSLISRFAHNGQKSLKVIEVETVFFRKHATQIVAQGLPLGGKENLKPSSPGIGYCSGGEPKANKLLRHALNRCRHFLLSFWRIVAHNYDGANRPNSRTQRPGTPPATAEKEPPQPGSLEWQVRTYDQPLETETQSEAS